MGDSSAGKGCRQLVTIDLKIVRFQAADAREVFQTCICRTEGDPAPQAVDPHRTH